jgi:hypothetical protein
MTRTDTGAAGGYILVDRRARHSSGHPTVGMAESVSRAIMPGPAECFGLGSESAEAAPLRHDKSESLA